MTQPPEVENINILSLLPHRFPMLLVDRILELEQGVRVVGLKNVTINEPFFPGHFPGQPVMPGVIILESMAQIAGVMMLAVPDHHGKLVYIGGMDHVRFRRVVLPGDQLITEAHLLKLRGSIGKVHIVARVDGEIAAECDITFVLKDREMDDRGERIRD